MNRSPYSRVRLSLGETLMTVLCRVYLLAVHVASCIEILLDRHPVYLEFTSSPSVLLHALESFRIVALV